METPKIHPNSIFRWEDSASLEHSCWQCPTKANSPRALQTCYGTHSMPCTSYHPTMHAVGAAHRCSGCVSTREMHDARHREIAELLAEYKSLKLTPPETPTRTPLLERNVNINAAYQDRRDRDVFHQAGPGRRFEINGEEDEEHGEETASSSSHAPSLTDPTQATPSKKQSKAEIRAEKKAKKSVKSQNKALKNQTRNLASVTSADVDHVADVLHGEEKNATLDGSAHPLATDKTIEEVINRNLNFVKNIQAHKQYLFRSVAQGRRENAARKRLKKRESQGDVLDDTIEAEEVASAILLKLGLSPVVVSASVSTASMTASATPTRSTRPSDYASSARRRSVSMITATHSTSAAKSSGSPDKDLVAIATRMRTAIKNDLEKHENEVHMRYVRAGGFWRYVGKTVFERMTEIARELDVSTGERWEKKRTRRERDTSDAGTQEDEDGHAGALE